MQISDLRYIPYLSYTCAMNEDSSSLIETRVEVSLKRSNVLSQMNKLVIKGPSIHESYKIHIHKNPAWFAHDLEK